MLTRAEDISLRTSHHFKNKASLQERRERGSLQERRGSFQKRRERPGGVDDFRQSLVRDCDVLRPRGVRPDLIGVERNLKALTLDEPVPVVLKHSLRARVYHVGRAFEV